MQQLRQSVGGLGNIMFKQAYLIGKTLDGDIPDTYLQDDKYWKEHSVAIKNYFRFGAGQKIKKVALHIRRGDYLKAEHFHVNLCKTGYYEKALKLFPESEFLVFFKDRQIQEQDAADKVWVNEYLQNLIPDRFEFAQGSTEVDDMNLMMSCESIIMANSSFSWWAAYLNPNPSKIVVCPRMWFEDGVQRTKLFSEWIQI